MPTEQEKKIMETVENTRIMWDETPQSVMGPQHEQVIRSQEDLERLQQRDLDLVGYGYFYIGVWNCHPRLALMHSTKPGYWTGQPIPEELSPLLEEDMIRCVEDAGGALNRSGHYPLDGLGLAKVRASYLGDGDTSFFVEG